MTAAGLAKTLGDKARPIPVSDSLLLGNLVEIRPNVSSSSSDNGRRRSSGRQVTR